MGNFVSYLISGMMICGVAYADGPQVRIEGPVPYSASEKISDETHERALKSLDKLTDKIKSNVKSWHRLNLGKEEYERRFGRNATANVLREIRLEDESELEYEIRIRRGRYVIPEEHKGSFGLFEVQGKGSVSNN